MVISLYYAFQKIPQTLIAILELGSIALSVGLLYIPPSNTHRAITQPQENLPCFQNYVWDPVHV